MEDAQSLQLRRGLVHVAPDLARSAESLEEGGDRDGMVVIVATGFYAMDNRGGGRFRILQKGLEVHGLGEGILGFLQRKWNAEGAGGER